MQDDMWAPPPDSTRDRYSAYMGMAPPSGPPLQVAPPPPSYLVFGILTTVLCFLPFGIVSIVKGSSVAGLWAQGRYEEAYRASRAARNWAIAALVTLPVLVTLVFMAFFLTLLAVSLG